MTNHNNLLQGVRYLLEGFKLIFQPGLKRFLIIPLLLNLLIYIGIFFLFQQYINTFNQWMDHYLPSWLHWVHTFLWLIFMTGYIIIMIYSFVTLSNIVCLPFNSLLSEKVQLHITGQNPLKKSLWEFFKDFPHLLSRQLALMGYFLPRALFLFILFWVPVVQIFAGFLWVLFNGWMMTIQHIDYPMDNNHCSFSELRRHLSMNRWSSLGFGISVLFFTMIPVLNLLTIPAAVAGATSFWLKDCNHNIG